MKNIMCCHSISIIFVTIYYYLTLSFVQIPTDNVESQSQTQLRLYATTYFEQMDCADCYTKLRKTSSALVEGISIPLPIV